MTQKNWWFLRHRCPGVPRRLWSSGLTCWQNVEIGPQLFCRSVFSSEFFRYIGVNWTDLCFITWLKPAKIEVANNRVCPDAKPWIAWQYESKFVNNSAQNKFLAKKHFADILLTCTVNDRFSGDLYSGNDRFSGPKTPDDAILCTGVIKLSSSHTLMLNKPPIDSLPCNETQFKEFRFWWDVVVGIQATTIVAGTTVIADFWALTNFSAKPVVDCTILFASLFHSLYLLWAQSKKSGFWGWVIVTNKTCCHFL